MLAKQPVSTVTQDREAGAGGDQSVTRSEESIIQKNHDADSATPMCVTTAAAFGAPAPFVSSTPGTELLPEVPSAQVSPH